MSLNFSLPKFNHQRREQIDAAHETVIAKGLAQRTGMAEYCKWRIDALYPIRQTPEGDRTYLIEYTGWYPDGDIWQGTYEVQTGEIEGPDGRPAIAALYWVAL